MNDVFRQNAIDRGAVGKFWLDSIPEIISEYEKKWSFSAKNPFSLSYNYVAPVRQDGGAEAVLKIGFPEDEEFQSEIEALYLYGGEGMVKILKSDAKRSVMIIEKISPGLPLSQNHDDEKATLVLAGLMRKLEKPPPKSSSFILLKDWVSEIYECRRVDAEKYSIPMDFVKKARFLFKELLSSSTKSVVTHGDLHHDNILMDGDDWQVIDPKGVIAEPAYEVAAMIRNPYEQLRQIKDLEPILRKRIAILADQLSLDPRRIHRWCFAQTMLSAVWNMKNVKGADHAVRVATTLNKMQI